MSAKVVVRKAIPSDFDFIMDSWINGQYHGSPHWSQTPKQLFYGQYSIHIRHLLTSPSVTTEVAVLEDDPNMVVGYLVSEPDTLHWAYTKVDYRGLGVMNLLIGSKPLTQVSSTTLPGRVIARKKKLIFNPFQGIKD